MTLFSIFGVSIISLFISFFPLHLSYVSTRSQSNQKHTTFPSMSTMQKISPTIAPTAVTIYNTNQPILTPTPTSFPEDSIFIQEINQYRQSLGLSAVDTDNNVCNFAKIRAKEISTNFSHDGFNQRVQSHTLPYASYALVTENIAETPNAQDVIQLWKNSSIHAQNMRADTPYVCVESYGNYYVYEGLKP